MRGRGSVPSPEAVNEVFWIGFTYICREPNKRIAIHCTHGYNRTGTYAAQLQTAIMRIRMQQLTFV